MMKCPICNAEMETGTASLMGLQGFSQMICSFTSEQEKSKGLLKRKTQTKILLSGAEAAAHYCTECDIIIPLLK